MPPQLSKPRAPPLGTEAAGLRLGGGLRRRHARLPLLLGSLLTEIAQDQPRAFQLLEMFPEAAQVLEGSGRDGLAVVDRLREQDWSVSAFRAAARPCSGHFANRRAELYWNLRCRLASDSPMPLAIPRRMKRLCRELSAISYGFDSRGLIRIDGKDLLRSRLGTSPDHADALAIALDTLSQAPSSPRAWEL